MIEVQPQAAAVFCVEGEVNILPQVRFERALGQSQLARRVEADFRDARQAEIPGGEEICGNFGSGNVSPRRPDRQDGWQSRQTPPFTYHVVDVEQFRAGNSEPGRGAYRLAFRAGPTIFFNPHGYSQSRITNQERRVCLLQHRTQVGRRFRDCVLRELRSSAKLFTCSMGFFAMISRLRTCFFEAMAMSGRITRSSMRWYSMAGIIAMSALPVRNCSAHCEGTVNDKSYLPRSGPLVKPQTSGAVFRY